MPEVSFRWFASRFVPGGNPRKQAVLGLALLLASGCGGGAGGSEERLVRDAGFSFSAPADWSVARSGNEVRASQGLSLLSVTRFPLLRAFRAELWEKVVPELDRAAAQVAKQQEGTVSDAQTVTVADRRARRYDVAYEGEGKELVERLAFVLRGKTEYLLLCRYERGGETRACERLLATFRLT
jgi:hypothetical protein